MKVFFMFCLFIQFFQSCKHVYLVSVDEALSLLNQISSPKLQCTLKICINEQKCYFMSMLDILINIVVAEVCTQPETLIQSLSTQPQADVVKWRFISKSCSIFRTAEVIGDLSLNEKKQQESQHQIFSKPRQACPMSMGAPRSQMDLQRPYLHPFQSGIPHFSCQGKSLSAPHLESSTVRGVNNVFSNPFGVLGPPENWLKFMKTVEVFFSCFFFFFYILKRVPNFFSLLGECCDTVLLWSSRNVLWTTKLHLTSHQHGGEKIITKTKCTLALIMQQNAIINYITVFFCCWIIIPGA